MLSDYFEPFTLLHGVCQPDPIGGQVIDHTEETRFSAALGGAVGQETEEHGRSIASSRPMLLCPMDVPLHFGDIVRRESTGICYRVCTNAEDMRTPACAGFSFCEALLERLGDAP